MPDWLIITITLVLVLAVGLYVLGRFFIWPMVRPEVHEVLKLLEREDEWHYFTYFDNSCGRLHQLTWGCTEKGPRVSIAIAPEQTSMSVDGIMVTLSTGEVSAIMMKTRGLRRRANRKQRELEKAWRRERKEKKLEQAMERRKRARERLSCFVEHGASEECR